ncbi:ABC transporter permease [Haploplasma axanthum]|uniref:Dipeptide/oligopeptide/nickel ABC transporter permease DppB/OppB n=1 Tax=Haploplasma axanthum TaxID=29552 RepID=A0A449BCL0_HAPAX|nr:ABC transporter permease [Haploplasma axanthum]VEU80070.1 dipeptide/oligopeptide/nickel ABC transporter permease DppB/OppB [Haploplasma axanthum]
MYKYIIKRILWLIPILLGVALIVFTIMYASPGDAATLILGENASPEALAKLRAEMGLDQPFFVQFFRYIKDVFLRFDLGRSYVTRRDILGEILLRLPNTIKLAVLSILVASILGIILGIISATKPNSVADNTSMMFSLIGVSMPTFWQGLLFIILFSLTLGWFPATGFSTPSEMILPVLTLATSSMGSIARITRSSMFEIMDQDYIRTAYAKGLSKNKVIYEHALRNALIPIVTVIGLQFGTLLGGAVLTESIFGINGIGVLMVNAIMQRDIMMVQGGVLFIAFLFSIVNLIVDILYAYIDPRIKSQYK